MTSGPSPPLGSVRVDHWRACPVCIGACVATLRTVRTSVERVAGDCRAVEFQSDCCFRQLASLASRHVESLSDKAAKKMRLEGKIPSRHKAYALQVPSEVLGVLGHFSLRSFSSSVILRQGQWGAEKYTFHLSNECENNRALGDVSICMTIQWGVGWGSLSISRIY